jgi:hypothetical protein
MFMVNGRIHGIHIPGQPLTLVIYQLGLNDNLHDVRVFGIPVNYLLFEYTLIAGKCRASGTHTKKRILLDRFIFPNTPIKVDMMVNIRAVVFGYLILCSGINHCRLRWWVL